MSNRIFAFAVMVWITIIIFAAPMKIGLIRVEDGVTLEKYTRIVRNYDAEYTSITLGPLELRYTAEEANKGQVEVRENAEFINSENPDNKYGLNVHELRDGIEQKVTLSCYLEDLKDWTVCPIPYDDQLINIVSYRVEDYDNIRAGITPQNTMSLVYDTLHIKLPANMDENIDNFKDRTTWFYYDESSEIERLADKLYEMAGNDIKYIRYVMCWVYCNIEYDNDMAEAIKQDMYVNRAENIVNTYYSRKGVCLNKAALMTALLRAKGIPCRLVSGYMPEDAEVRHAWCSVYCEGSWIDCDPTNFKVGDLNYFERYHR